jgi:mRNA degradation ribonuclease J1/J2
LELFHKREAEKKISRIQDDFLSDEPVITRSEDARKIGELRGIIEKADAEIARLQSIAQVAKQSQEKVAAARKALETLRNINLKTATFQEKAELVAQLGVKIYPNEDFTYIRICFGLNVAEPRKVTCYKTSMASPKL